jgi:hypothetical protein
MVYAPPHILNLAHRIFLPRSLRSRKRRVKILHFLYLFDFRDLAVRFLPGYIHSVRIADARSAKSRWCARQGLEGCASSHAAGGAGAIAESRKARPRRGRRTGGLKAARRTSRTG